jgi:hypothetical protein
LSEGESHRGTKSTLEQVSTANWGGVLGLVAGKVKTRDQVVVTAAAVFVGLPLFRAEGLIIGLAAGIATFVVCGLLIRIRKWQLGVPRGSSDY